MLTLHFIDPGKHSDAIKAIDAGAAWRTSKYARGIGRKNEKAEKAIEAAEKVETAFKIFLEEFEKKNQGTDFGKASAKIFIAVHKEHEHILYPPIKRTPI
jgi:hypothetical protein